MNIYLTVLLFAIGIALVVKGGDFFVDSASFIARATGIPPFIVGATIVSVATTLPEMLVSLTAAFDGKPDMAVGNSIGSVIANTGLILSIAMIFMQFSCKRKEYLLQYLILVASAVLLYVFSLEGTLPIYGAALLIIPLILFLMGNVKTAKQNSEAVEKLKYTKKDVTKNAVLFIVGITGIVVGSQLLVDSASSLATFFGVPERIIAVTLVAVGTSLPELVTTITAIVKKQANLSAGNIIGANIINLTLVLPLCSILTGQPLPVAQQSLAFDMPVAIGFLLLMTLPLLVREKSSKVQGIVMLGSYFTYLAFVF